MSYLSFFNPLLRELGQGHAFLSRSIPLWGPSVFYHSSLHDLWGRRHLQGFGDTDIHETKDIINITTDFPGISKENVKVFCSGDILTIKGERSEDITLSSDIYGDMERSFGEVTKQIRLPHGLLHKDITAKYTNGVLLVTIPKPKVSETECEPVSIPVV